MEETNSSQEEESGPKHDENETNEPQDLAASPLSVAPSSMCQKACTMFVCYMYNITLCFCINIIVCV